MHRQLPPCLQMLLHEQIVSSCEVIVSVIFNGRDRNVCFEAILQKPLENEWVDFDGVNPNQNPVVALERRLLKPWVRLDLGERVSLIGVGL